MAFWGFPRYVPKAEKQARAAKKLEQLKKKRDVRPVVLQGSAIYPSSRRGSGFA